MAGDGGDKYKQFDDLVGRYRKLIRKLCWRHSSDSETRCDELVQDCYIAIWCHLPSLRPDANTFQLTAWIVWQCRSVFSHRQRARQFDWIPIDERMLDTLAAPSDTYRQELAIDLADGLDPDEQRLLSLMLEGYGQREIAKQLGVSVEAAKKMRQRLTTKLRKKYKD